MAGIDEELGKGMKFQSNEFSDFPPFKDGVSLKNNINKIFWGRKNEKI
jgi:hypothetical protein